MSKPVRILVVDDEPQIRRFLRHALEASGYDCDFAGTAQEAFACVKRSMPDIVILDLGLPDLDGKMVIGQLRQSTQVPILVLSARDAESEKVAALDLGASDFVVKPFGIGELLARIRVCLRAGNAGSTSVKIVEAGPLVIDVERHLVTNNGQTIHLTPKEFELLLLLARHSGRVLSQRQILEKIWGPAHHEDVAYLRVFVGQLRQKIEAIPSEPRLIVTEPGVGYRFADMP